MRVTAKSKVSWNDAYSIARDKADEYFDLDGMPICGMGYAEIYSDVLEDLKSRGVSDLDAQSLSHCAVSLYWPMELVYR